MDGVGVVAVDDDRLQPVGGGAVGRGRLTAVMSEIAVYSMYRLFSHTKTTGSLKTAA